MTQFSSWVRRPVRASYLGHNSGVSPVGPEKGSRVYAIAFDLNMDALKAHYPAGKVYNGAYEGIRRVLEDHGFTHQQGSMYFGNARVTPVQCVVAVQDIQKQHSWFAKAVRDIRMLRIEEHNDLMPAIAQQDLFPKAANG